MAYIPGSSFIPKDTNATPKVMQRKRTFHIFGFIASVMLVVSLLMAGGVFGYQIKLENDLEKVQKELAEAKTEDFSVQMAEIAVFDQQLKTAKRLLDNHIAPSRIFAELEKMTTKTVHYKAFEYTYDPGYLAELSVLGGTDEITSVASQKIEFANQQLFTDFSIENISLSLENDKEGSAPSRSDSPVSFGISGTLDTEPILYTGVAVGAETETFPQATTATTSDKGLETSVVADPVPDNVITP